tara:strand:- start:684 stop:1181 length:498 start_codon:yes stop_codon:yes gene_type:complete
MENKTHYRKVFKSDHLGVADLEEFNEEKRTLIFTIKEVKQEFNVAVAGRKGNHNIAYFIDGIKPLVLNATNSKIVKSFNKNSPFVEDWKLTKIELHIDYAVKMKGETVGGVRIKPIQPKEKVKPEFNEKNFEPAHKAKASLDTIKKSYNVTIETGVKYLDYVAKN